MIGTNADETRLGYITAVNVYLALSHSSQSRMTLDRHGLRGPAWLRVAAERQH